MLVFFRVLQGAAGGGLQPSEQSILADTFPPQKRSMAFAVYGMAVVMAPVLGPTVGGWIVDNYSWRWIFFINIPVGIVSLYLTNRVVEDPPYLAEIRKRRKASTTGDSACSLSPSAQSRPCSTRARKTTGSAPASSSPCAIIAAIGLVVFFWRELHHRASHPRPAPVRRSATSA